MRVPNLPSKVVFIFGASHVIYVGCTEERRSTQLLKLWNSLLKERGLHMVNGTLPFQKVTLSFREMRNYKKFDRLGLKFFTVLQQRPDTQNST